MASSNIYTSNFRRDQPAAACYLHRRYSLPAILSINRGQRIFVTHDSVAETAAFLEGGGERGWRGWFCFYFVFVFFLFYFYLFFSLFVVPLSFFNFISVDDLCVWEKIGNWVKLGMKVFVYYLFTLEFSCKRSWKERKGKQKLWTMSRDLVTFFSPLMKYYVSSRNKVWNGSMRQMVQMRDFSEQLKNRKYWDKRKSVSKDELPSF